jgi:hypothetical protein
MDKTARSTQFGASVSTPVSFFGVNLGYKAVLTGKRENLLVMRPRRVLTCAVREFCMNVIWQGQAITLFIPIHKGLHP